MIRNIKQGWEWIKKNPWQAFNVFWTYFFVLWFIGIAIVNFSTGHQSIDLSKNPAPKHSDRYTVGIYALMVAAYWLMFHQADKRGDKWRSRYFEEVNDHMATLTRIQNYINSQGKKPGSYTNNKPQ